MLFKQGYQQIAREIREFYFKDAAVDEKTLQQYVALLSDISLAYGIERAAKRHAEKSPSKAYLLRYLSLKYQITQIGTSVISFPTDFRSPRD